MWAPKYIYFICILLYMKAVRVSLTLPEEIAEELKRQPNKSKFVADSIREKSINERKARVREAALRLKKDYLSSRDLHAFGVIESEDFSE